MRRAGTTTALSRLAVEVKGYLIVSSIDMKKSILKNNSDIKESQVFTLSDVSQGKLLGLPIAPIFFDNDVVARMCLDTEKITSNLKTNYYDGYGCLESEQYSSKPVYTSQLNVKLTEEDMRNITEINKDFFEDEASNSMLGRILLRKGIAFYKKIKTCV